MASLCFCKQPKSDLKDDQYCRKEKGKYRDCLTKKTNYHCYEKLYSGKWIANH